jgi:tripartite ATP-independent transporter DctP family solute receptor
MFSRRQIVIAGSSLVASQAAHRVKAAPAGIRRLRIGYLLPIDSQLGAGAAALAEEVAGRTGGRIRIQQFPNSALGGEVEMLRDVQLGAIDLAFITGAPLPSVLPEAGIFDIPFLFNDLAHAHTVLDGPIGESYLNLLSAKGLIALAWGENGMRHITNSKRPIESPEDLQGLKLRLPQSPAMLVGFRAMGADASALPFPQVYGALEAGLFDGQENPIATICAAKFDQVQRFLTLSRHVYDPAVIVMSPDAHDELAPEDRAIIRDAAKIGARASRLFAAEAEMAGVPKLKKAGMDVVSSIDRSRFKSAMASANSDFNAMFGAWRIEQVRNAA